MRDHRGTIVMLFVLAGAAGAVGAATSADDDLAVVKRAVSSPRPTASASATSARAGEAGAPAGRAPTTRPASERAPRAADRVTIIDDEEPPPVRRRVDGRTPQWLKVRIVERGKRGHVMVNLPLGVARALGDDFPIDLGCHRGRRCATVRLGDVLRGLETGHNLVEIEEEDTSVRVWVE